MLLYFVTSFSLINNGGQDTLDAFRGKSKFNPVCIFQTSTHISPPVQLFFVLHFLVDYMSTCVLFSSLFFQFSLEKNNFYFEKIRER
jgi:hypothetical protein